MQEITEKALNVIDSLFKECNHDPEKTVAATLDFYKKRLDCSSKDLLKVIINIHIHMIIINNITR